MSKKNNLLTEVSRAVLLLAAIHSTAFSARADLDATLDIDAGHPGNPIPPTFCGLMTEEINHSYDGGLFAELVQNRTFQDRGNSTTGSLVHWSLFGSGKMVPDQSDPVNPALPVSLRLDLSGSGAGIANDGYWGIPVWPNTVYTASFYAKAGQGFAGSVVAGLVGDEGSVVFAKGETQPISNEWKRYTVKLTTPSTVLPTSKARFVLSAAGTGSVWFSLVSLFPPTYQNTPGGLRRDLMTLLAGLHPAFIRLPGGNYAEGGSFATRFNWKQMIGQADHRPGHMGCWGYRSSDGFGLPEYLLWCKQLGAEPVLAVFAGYTLDGQHVDAGTPEMAQYAEEALQEIEYVSGPPASEWGRRRAADGFPEPFPLHYVEIGNEDGFDKSGSYDGRFAEIATAIRNRYPSLKLIATAPVTTVKPDLVDDHYYSNPQGMIDTANKYDKPVDPSAPLTFVGEWASQEGNPTPDLGAALADAVFEMGLERTSNTVLMQCYAPLLCNVNDENKDKGYPKAWQWGTNLIGYDALQCFGSPSYYAQAMFARNKGDVLLPTTFQVPNTTIEPDPNPHGMIGVGSWHTQNEYKDITVTGPDGSALFKLDPAAGLTDWKFTGGDWKMQDGEITPPPDSYSSWAITGDTTWTDYTVHLQARKVSGDEGFLILWHAADGNNYQWWNIGGWGNTGTGCEAAHKGAREGYGPHSSFTVEPGRWYDLRIEVKGNHMQGFIDGNPVTASELEPHPGGPAAYASATYLKQDHSVIVKVVNVGHDPIKTAININGAGHVDPNGQATVLTGSLDAVNTIENPTNVTPTVEKITSVSESFTQALPPYSFTLIKLTASPK